VVRGWGADGGRPGEGESGSPAPGATVEPPSVRLWRTFFLPEIVEDFFGRAIAMVTGRD
jgi:hypothetical protein